MSDSPNLESIAVWNQVLVPKFTRFRHTLVEGMSAHSRAAFDRHAPGAGEQVLDVGCGFGETSIELGRMVGGGGAVLGVDCCEAFLDVARTDAARACLAHVRFALADAETERFPPVFDLCFARFGTMFFQSPVAAMSNLRRALKPGGRLMMLVWRRLEDNPWAAIPKRIARVHLPPLADEASTCGPGPFSMADPDTVRAVLDAAGWRAVELERVDAPMHVGANIDEAIAFQVALGPVGQLVREAGECGEAKRPLIEADLRSALAPIAGPRGISLGSSSWCVTARAPG